MAGVDAVTGAFGYTGSFIAERLLERGRTVRTLTRRPAEGHPLVDRVQAVPLPFDDEAALVGALRGLDTPYNTHWPRVPRREAAVPATAADSGAIIAAPSQAGPPPVLPISSS